MISDRSSLAYWPDAVDRRQPIAEQFVCPDVGFGLDLAAGVLLVDRPAATDQPLSDLGR